ncbi:MAG: DUF3107 domain-containing protein [Acidimicrobiia bacterium]
MEVNIGVVYSPKELSIESDDTIDDVVAAVEAALTKGGPVLWLNDRKGRKVGVPADKVAYVEINEEDTTRRVGFGPS